MRPEPATVEKNDKKMLDLSDFRKDHPSTYKLVFPKLPLKIRTTPARRTTMLTTTLPLRTFRPLTKDQIEYLAEFRRKDPEIYNGLLQTVADEGKEPPLPPTSTRAPTTQTTPKPPPAEDKISSTTTTVAPTTKADGEMSEKYGNELFSSSKYKRQQKAGSASEDSGINSSETPDSTLTYIKRLDRFVMGSRPSGVSMSTRAFEKKVSEWCKKSTSDEFSSTTVKELDSMSHPDLKDDAFYKDNPFSQGN